jgi:hypothetical protein
MKALVFVLLAGALALGCEEKKSSEGAAPSATTAASAPAPTASAAPAVASATAAATASAAPSASAAAAANVPTEEDYQKKVETTIATPSAAEVELSKLEKEIGP